MDAIIGKRPGGRPSFGCGPECLCCLLPLLVLQYIVQARYGWLYAASTYTLPSTRTPRFALNTLLLFVGLQTKMAYDPLTDAFTVQASVGFQRGDQVFINYGPSCNDSLLMYYGFVEPGNPLDTCELEVAAGGRSVLVGAAIS